jgi:hypothetical protein
MTIRRRPLLLLLAFVVLAGVGAVKLIRRPPPGITLENACRLEAGMTMDQVAAILGSPPTGQCAAWDNPRDGADSLWVSKAAVIQVGFHGPRGTLSRASVFGDDGHGGRPWLLVIPRLPLVERLYMFFLTVRVRDG